jgi:hypothetical protein
LYCFDHNHLNKSNINIQLMLLIDIYEFLGFLNGFNKDNRKTSRNLHYKENIEYYKTV